VAEKKTELRFSSCTRKKEEGKIKRRVEDDLTRMRLSRYRGECSARKRRDLRDRQRVVLDDEDTRGCACTETSVRLRTGSRCYLRDAAHGCAHNGDTTRRNAHMT